MVVGHSMGTMVAMAMALEFPGRRARLVLLGGYYYPSCASTHCSLLRSRMPVLGDVMRYTVTAVSRAPMINGAVKAMFIPNAVPSDFLPALSREMMLRPSNCAPMPKMQFSWLPGHANSGRHRELHLPVTIFAGAEDAIIDVEAHSVRLHSELSQSKLVVVPGAGHMIHYEALDEIVAAIDFDLPLHESLTESALKPLGLEEVTMPSLSADLCQRGSAVQVPGVA